MPYCPGRDDRRSLRLREYDYSTPAAYFITVCTAGRRCSLGDITAGTAVLSAAGTIAATAWVGLSRRFDSVVLDEYVIMPNHLHAIIHLGADTGGDGRAGRPGVGARFIAPGSCARGRSAVWRDTAPRRARAR